MVHSLTTASHDPRWIRSGQQAHQVKKMATFFDKGAATIGIKAVPIANFFQERKSVLADAEHLQTACHAFKAIFQGRNGRHVAIFHSHPDRRVILGFKSLNAGQILSIGE